MKQRNKIRWQVTGVLLLVFFLGGITGSTLNEMTHLWGQHDKTISTQSAASGTESPEGKGIPPFPPFLDRLRLDLNLQDEQVTAIRRIFQETRKEFHLARLQECPEMKAMREKTNARIREVLTPEQQKQFDDFIARRQFEFREPK